MDSGLFVCVSGLKGENGPPGQGGLQGVPGPPGPKGNAVKTQSSRTEYYNC